jgi:hypothetical protein
MRPLALYGFRRPLSTCAALQDSATAAINNTNTNTTGTINNINNNTNTIGTINNNNTNPSTTPSIRSPLTQPADSRRIVQAWLHAFPSLLQPTGIALLDGAVFAAPIRKDVMHRVVVYHRSLLRGVVYRRQMGRGEVTYSRRKVRPQKRMGRARVSDRGSPLFRKGTLFITSYFNFPSFRYLNISINE